MKMWFLKPQMPNLSGRINYDPFLKAWNFFTAKIPMKYSKNGQNFSMSKNISNVLIATCWTPCKTPHLSRWSSSRYTFLITPYSVIRPSFLDALYSSLRQLGHQHTNPDLKNRTLSHQFYLKMQSLMQSLIATFNGWNCLEIPSIAINSYGRVCLSVRLAVGPSHKSCISTK